MDVTPIPSPLCTRRVTGARFSFSPCLCLSDVLFTSHVIDELITSTCFPLVFPLLKPSPSLYVWSLSYIDVGFAPLLMSRCLSCAAVIVNRCLCPPGSRSSHCTAEHPWTLCLFSRVFPSPRWLSLFLWFSFVRRADPVRVRERAT